jgi:FkbM family methyltransferase
MPHSQADSEWVAKYQVIQAANRLFNETGEVLPQMAATFWGDSMHVTLPEVISNALFLNGFFEVDVTNFMLRTIEVGMTVLDVGAHFGANTLLAAALVGPAGEVHAFEPMPENFAVLSRNVTSKEKVTVNQCAVWNEETWLTLRNFGLTQSAMSTARVPRIPYPPRMERPPLVIPTVTLDDYVAKYKLAPSFVKIDVEGAEPEVIQGMTNVLHQFRPALVIELVDAGPTISWPCRQIVDYLCEHGYQAIEYDAKADALRPHQPRDRYQLNLLFIPR